MKENIKSVVDRIVDAEAARTGQVRDDLVIRIWAGQEVQRLFSELLAEGVTQEQIARSLRLEQPMEFTF